MSRTSITNINSINAGHIRRSRGKGALHDCARCQGQGFLVDFIRGNMTCPVCKGKGKNRV